MERFDLTGTLPAGTKYPEDLLIEILTINVRETRMMKNGVRAERSERMVVIECIGNGGTYPQHGLIACDGL